MEASHTDSLFIHFLACKKITGPRFLHAMACAFMDNRAVERGGPRHFTAPCPGCKAWPASLSPSYPSDSCSPFVAEHCVLGFTVSVSCTRMEIRAGRAAAELHGHYARCRPWAVQRRNWC